MEIMVPVITPGMASGRTWWNTVWVRLAPMARAASRIEGGTAFSAEREADFKPLPTQEVLAAARVDAPQDLCNGDFLRLWPHRHGTDTMFIQLLTRR
jgi:hypothetical protein